MSDQIYVLMEDLRDYDFYEKIIEPILNDKYDQVIPYKYIKKKKSNVIRYLNVINKTNADYFVLTDMDDSTSIDEAKEKISRRMDNLIEKNNVIVVIKEIECWYISGLPNSFIESHEISLNISDTEIYYKEDFESIKPSNLTHAMFYSRILEIYDYENAIRRNGSLNYFMSRIS